MNVVASTAAEPLVAEEARATEKGRSVACVQSPGTGFAGAASMIALYVAYTRFQVRLPRGGPNWHTLWGFPDVARDYVDILLCLLATFVIMLVFEKATALIRWLAASAIGVAALAVSQASIATWSLGGETVTVPEIALGSALGVVLGLLGVDLLVRRKRGLAPATPLRREVGWGHAARSGFVRWLALWGTMSAAIGLYLGTKHYAGLPAGTNSYYMNWRITAAALWWGFTLLGLPYFMVTVKCRSCFREDRSDPGLIVLLLARRTWALGPAELLRLLKQRRIRVVVLDLLVKFFWAPLMVTFLFNECGSFHSGLDGSLPVFGKAGLAAGLDRLARAFFGSADAGFLDDSYHMVYHGLFLVDCSIGLLGYLTSSRWLGTKSKSVDSTALGWGVALICYPPFNDVTGQLIPYDANHGAAYAIFGYTLLHHLLMLFTIGLFTIYVWGTVVFGLRFSNLTHRGVIDTGPFKWIRHPAYATKNLAWWTESVLRFGSPWQFAYLAGCNFIYVMRALTEERHLMQHDDYRQYAARVKWRFIPGLF